MRDSEQTVRELSGLLQAARGEAQVTCIRLVCLFPAHDQTMMLDHRWALHPTSSQTPIPPPPLKALRGELVAAQADREEVEAHVSVLEDALAEAEVGGWIDHLFESPSSLLGF